jgi:hypothetical protein
MKSNTYKIKISSVKELILILLAFLPGIVPHANATVNTSSDTLTCLPIEFHISPLGYQGTNNDTAIVCLYENIILESNYSGDAQLSYSWSNGSTNPELPLSTSGIGMDVQKIWLVMTDPLTGCTYSDTLNVIFSSYTCVGINENDGELPIEIYPNPAHDVLYFDFTEFSGSGQLYLFNSSGQAVFQRDIQNDYPVSNLLQLDTHFLPRGLYLAKFVGEQKQFSSKIILK